MRYKYQAKLRREKKRTWICAVLLSELIIVYEDFLNMKHHSLLVTICCLQDIVPVSSECKIKK